ncbi:MAG: folate-binding protein [Pseudomonadota bacterium]
MAEFMTGFTNPWLAFLQQHGARVTESDTPEVTGFDVGTVQTAGGIVAPLTGLGLIALSGEDAASFLHNQLTNDVENLSLTEARLAGYCSPKGRLLASFLMWKSGDNILLQLPRQLQPPIQKRLQMFVLRAKAKLADVTDSHVLLGLAGPAAASALAPWFAELPPAPYAKTESAAGTLIRLADAGGEPRYQWVTTTSTAQEAWPALSVNLQPVGAGAWRLMDIEAGIPQITLPTQEQFVPQMVNYELIGGVNFRKGCYPGQEIVARSQYLGKLKRRMLLASTAAPDASAGMEVFSSTDPEQPCGMIVNAESSGAGRMDCLVQIKTAALDQGTIHLGSATGPALDFKPLPYPLPDPA